MVNNGVFAVLGRILSGKPAFEDYSNALSTKQDTKNSSESGVKYVDDEGFKIFPKVYIQNVDFHASGNYAELWVDVLNDSPYQIHIDKIRLLGRTTELDFNLEPGRSRNLLAYKGEAITNKPDSRAELWYKIIDNNDFFMNRHTMIYSVDSEGAYSIERFEAANVPFDT